MKISRTGSGLALAAAVSLVLAGCASGGNLSASDSATTASTWNDPTASLEGVTLTFGGGTVGGPVDQVLDAFEEATGVTIKRVAYPDPYEQTLETKVATGDMPDLAAWQPTTSMLTALQAPTNLLSLDDAPWLDSMDSTVRDSTGFLDGTRYAALVTSPSVMGVYYNKKLLTDAGITEMPTNWDEFVADARTVKAAGTTPFYEAGSSQWPTQWWVQVQLAEAAQDGLWDRVNTGEEAFTDDTILSAITEYQSLIDEGLFNDDYKTATFEEQADALMTGKAAMAVQVSSLLEQIQTEYSTEEIDDTLGWFPISADGQVATSIPDNKNGIVVFNTGDEETEAAAKQLLNFWMTTDYSDFVTENGTVSLEPEVQTPDSVPQIAVEMADSLTDSIGSMQSLAIANPDLYINLSTMLYGKMTPEEVASTTQKQFAQLAKAQGAEGF